MDTNEVTQIENLIQSFDPIALTDLDKVKLLDRQDTKYTIHIKLLNTILQKVKPYYFALNISSKQLMEYETLYFDTPNFEMYTKHHNGQLNRYKVRYRRYVDSNQSFLEIKFKNNKKRTIKTRLFDTTNYPNISAAGAEFIKENTPFEAPQLAPNVWVLYKRMTLVSKDLTERVTIDIDLVFKDYDQANKNTYWDNIAIIEIKQDRTSRTSKMLQLLRNEKIPAVGISKYCIGTVFTKNEVKKNAFKPNLILIEKLLQKTQKPRYT